MVIKHQQDAGDDENEEGPERERAQIPGRSEAEHATPHFGREKVQEDVLLDGESAMEGAGSGAAAKHGAPDPRAFQPCLLYTSRCV